GLAMLQRVPIVIPTHNAGPALDDVLTAIAAQTGPFQPGIIAIDSGSTDGTVDRLKRGGARILSVAAEEFNHGQTRNEALQHAQGGSECAILLVQDAIPASPGWLSALVQPLLDDSSMAGEFSRQKHRA